MSSTGKQISFRTAAAMSGTDSEEEVDQLEAFRNASVKPGMFVSGWEDPNDEVAETSDPRGE